MVLRGLPGSERGSGRARGSSPRPGKRPTSVLPQASLTAASSLRPWICSRRSTPQKSLLFRPVDSLCEVYPAAIWTRLARRLPNKRRAAGRRARAAILKALGVALPETAFTHDQLDACVAALLGAAADGHTRGIGIAAVGDTVFWDEATGCLREGQIVVPNVDSELRAKLETVVRSLAVSAWRKGRHDRSLRRAPPASTKRLEERTQGRPSCVDGHATRRNVPTNCSNTSSWNWSTAAQRSARTKRLWRCSRSSEVHAGVRVAVDKARDQIEGIRSRGVGRDPPRYVHRHPQKPTTRRRALGIRDVHSSRVEPRVRSGNGHPMRVTFAEV